MVNFVFLSVYFYSVPNLRFAGYIDNYRTCKLIDISEIVTRTNENNSEYPIMMISAGKGFIAQSEKYSRDNAGTSINKYILLKKGELAYNRGNSKQFPYGAIYEMKEECALIPYVYHCFNIYDESTRYFSHYLNSPFKDEQLSKIITSSVRGNGLLNISKNDFFNLSLNVPSIKEQNKIAKFLDLIDQRIQTQSKIIDTLSSQKKQIRNLIFKDIHKNANCCIQDYVIYEQPQKYIVHSTDYVSHGKDYTPVLTANQSFILGYTLEKDGIYKKGDCIIFDDFTNENKYVDFPFKVKSSALKILQTKEGLMLKFFYEYLQFLNFESTDHKRHYLSEVAVTDISVPNLKEQTFLCKIFTSFDNKLKNEEALLEKYRLQKQFLLNNLFI